MGIPTYGATKGIDQDAYEKLRMDQEILEKIAPLVIRERYLRDTEYVRVGQLFDAMLKTPGERRTVVPEVLESGIVQGVKRGLFGLGDLKDDNTPVCRFFREDATVSVAESEVLIREDICLTQRKAQIEGSIRPEVEPLLASGSGVQASDVEQVDTGVRAKGKNELDLRFRVPRGKVAPLLGILNYLQSKFQSLDVEITARDGSLSEEEYAREDVTERLKVRDSRKLVGTEWAGSNSLIESEQLAAGNRGGWTSRTDERRNRVSYLVPF